MNHKTEIEHLIIRYLDGTCSIAERKELDEWIGLSEKNRKTFYQVKDVWDASLKKEDKSHVALLDFYKQQASKNQGKTKVVKLWKTVAGVAAVLAIGFVSLFLLQTLNINSRPLENSALVSFKVPYGSRSEVQLSDGTTVVLNSGSELKYPGTFTNGKREVSLTGEAFFMVESDNKNPFIVETADFNVQVTGTRFNVTTYSDDDFSSVTLAEGKVGIQFNGNNQPVQIAPGQQLQINRENRKYVIKKAEVETETAWKDGEFRFKEIAFPELIKRLERWYDVTLTYSAPELEVMLYSGRFKNQETIWQVLDALKLTTPIDYKKTGFREFEIIYKPM